MNDSCEYCEEPDKFCVGPRIKFSDLPTDNGYGNSIHDFPLDPNCYVHLDKTGTGDHRHHVLVCRNGRKDLPKPKAVPATLRRSRP